MGIVLKDADRLLDRVERSSAVGEDRSARFERPPEPLTCRPILLAADPAALGHAGAAVGHQPPFGTVVARSHCHRSNSLRRLPVRRQASGLAFSRPIGLPFESPCANRTDIIMISILEEREA